MKNLNENIFQLRLKQLREHYGMTQSHMADILGISMRAYQRYEATGSNCREPRLAALRTIADYFCISVDWMLGLSDDPRQHYFIHNSDSTDANHTAKLMANPFT